MEFAQSGFEKASTNEIVKDPISPKVHYLTILIARKIFMYI